VGNATERIRQRAIIQPCPGDINQPLRLIECAPEAADQAAAVVDEVSAGGLDVEVMVAGDGEIPHPPARLLRFVTAQHGGDASAGARRWIPYFSEPALTQRPVSWSQNRWLLVVSMTAVPS